uniref:hypothetical protein n=1 Tax=Mycobacterium avium TaxID=1764 RepID=UPI001F26F0D5
ATGGVEALARCVDCGGDAGGLLGDVVVVLLVAVCGCGVAVLVCGGDGGIELGEQLVVQFCGVFGVDP